MSKARKEWPVSELVRTGTGRYHEQCGSEVIGREVNSGWQGQALLNEKETGHKRFIQVRGT